MPPVMITLENMTPNSIVLANPSTNYGTIKGRDFYVINETLLNEECIAAPIRDGLIRVVKGTPKRIAPKDGKSLLQRKVDEVVSHHAGREVEEGDAEVVSTFKTEGRDYTPDAAPAPVAPVAEKQETLGQRLVRRGGRKKLAGVDKAPAIKSTPNDLKKKLANVVEVHGERPLPVRHGDAGAQLIIASDIPGGATMVGVDDMLWDQLSVLARETDKLVDGVVKDKKMHLYATMDLGKRQVFIERTTDVDFLREIAKYEWNLELKKMIDAKLKELSA